MNNLKTSHYRNIASAYIVIGALALIGGAVSIHYRVNSITPYLYSLDPNPGPIQTEAEQRLVELSEMRLLDSDSDGLNDFDEEYTYGTSAYLADTDSDGVNDQTEINTGDNPICAKGVVCEETRTAVADTDTTTTSLNGLAVDDPDKLREQLVSLGIPKNVLDQVNDDDLLEVYSSVAADYTNSNSTVSNIDPNANIDTTATNTDPYANLLPTEDGENSNITSAYTYDDFQNMGADDIRKLLISSGVAESDVSQLDDATLEQLFQESLKEQQDQTPTQ